MFWRRIVGATMSLGLGAYAIVSFFIADGLTHAERKAQEASPSDYGVAFQEASFSARGGEVNLSGWYLAGEQNRPALIFVHGINSTRSGEHSVDLATRLVRRGFTLLMFDLRGHGSSGGERISGGYFERADVLGAYDYLLSRGHKLGAMGVIGFSMGAAISLLAAADETGIHAVVADSPFAVAAERINSEAARKTRLPIWLTPVFMPTADVMAGAFYRIDIASIAPERAAARIPYPIFVIHGIADTRIPTADGIRVHDAGQPGSRLWLVPDADHVKAFQNNPDEYVARVGDYFDQQLSSASIRAIGSLAAEVR